MNVRSAHTITVFLLWSAFLSCRKEVSTEHDSGITPTAGSFTAQIDGVNWAAADSAKGAYLLGGQTTLIGISTDNRQLNITLNDTVTGVYTLNQTSVSTAAYAGNDPTDIYAYSSDQGSDTSQAGGIVTVTEIDKAAKTITGTFSFKLYRDLDGRQKTVTHGVFNQLPYRNSLPAANTGDTVQATIDGVDWSAQSIIAAVFSGQVTINGSNLNASQSVGLVMPLAITPGSYALDYTGLTYFGLYYPLPTISLASSTGTLIILENNSLTRRLRGNFNFQAINPLNPADLTHQLTNGYFSVQYN